MISQINNFELRDSINPMELNFHLLEDEDLAHLILEDCLQLLHSSFDEIESEKRQVWFKRLWNLLVFGSNKRRVDQARTHEECIGIFVEVLLSYLRFFPKKCSLLHQFLEALIGDKENYNFFAELLQEHQFEVILKENKITLINHQKLHQWEEAQKTLLIKMMVLAAYADDFISYGEQELIQWSIDVLLESNQSKRNCQIYLNNPKQKKQLIHALQAVKDFEFKKTVYESCLKVIIVDNYIHLSELDFIHKLELVLDLPSSERQSIKYLEAYFIDPTLSLEKAQTWRNPQNEEESEMFVDQLKSLVASFGWRYLNPLLLKLEQYYRYDHSVSIQKFIPLFSAESLRRMLLSNFDKLVKLQIGYLDELFPEVHGKLESFAPQLKNQLLKESTILDKKLLELAYTTETLEEQYYCHPSLFDSMTKQQCVEVLLKDLPPTSTDVIDLIKTWELNRMELIKSTAIFHNNITRFILDSIAQWLPSVNSEKLYY
ncbi:hypothetical protein WDW89_13640 [Deltaproteobacteria bacterium TL4]